MSYIDKISVGGTVYDIQDSNAAPQTEVDELKSATSNIEANNIAFEIGMNRFVSDGKLVSSENEKRASIPPTEVPAGGGITIVPNGYTITIYAREDGVWERVITGTAPFIADLSAYELYIIQVISDNNIPSGAVPCFVYYDISDKITDMDYPDEIKLEFDIGTNRYLSGTTLVTQTNVSNRASVAPFQVNPSKITITPIQDYKFSAYISSDGVSWSVLGSNIVKSQAFEVSSKSYIAIQFIPIIDYAAVPSDATPIRCEVKDYIVYYDSEIQLINQTLQEHEDEQKLLREGIDDIDKTVSKAKRVFCDLSNGTIVNPSNANAVQTATYIPCKNGDLVELRPVRPNAEGYVYQYAYAVYNSSKQQISSDFTQAAEKNRVYIKDANAAYIRFVIFEYNGTSFNALRYNTFGSVPFAMVFDENTGKDQITLIWDAMANLDKEVFNGPQVPCRLANGTIANASNSDFVNTVNYIPCKNGNAVTILPVRPNISGYHYRYGYLLYDSSKNAIGSQSSFTAENQTVVVENSSAAYIRFVIGEYENESVSTRNPLRYDTYGYTPFAIVADKPVDMFKDLLVDSHIPMIPGGIGSSGESWDRKYDGVYYTARTDYFTGSYIEVSEGYKASVGKYTAYGAATGTRTTDIYGEYKLEAGYYYRVELFHLDGSSVDYSEVDTEVFANNLTIKAMYDLSLTNDGALISVGGAKELTRDDSYTVNDLLSQSRYVYSPIDSGIASEKALTLLHFSDVHNDLPGMRYALAVYEKYKNKVDDILHTGDTVSANFSDGIENWIISGCAEKVLNVIGNHDTEENLVLQAAGKDNVYNAFFAPYIDGWNVTQPEGVDDSSSDEYHALYYYKDYADASVRLIVLDTNFWDSAQKSWLTDTLADAKELEYTVVIACHDVKLLTEAREINLSCYTGDGVNEQTDAYGNQPADWLDPVDDFVDAGGKFACILAGHNHAGHVGYMTNYPDIFVYMSQKGSIGRVSGAARISGERNQNVVSFVTINQKESLLKIVLHGADVDGLLRGRHVLCYNYASKTVISQW